MYDVIYIVDCAKSRERLWMQSGADAHERRPRVENRHIDQMRRDIYGKQSFSGG